MFYYPNLKYKYSIFREKRTDIYIFFRIVKKMRNKLLRYKLMFVKKCLNYNFCDIQKKLMKNARNVSSHRKAS